MQPKKLPKYLEELQKVKSRKAKPSYFQQLATSLQNHKPTKLWRFRELKTSLKAQKW